MIGSIPPFLIFIAGALVTPLLPTGIRAWWAMLVPLVGIVNLLLVADGVHWHVSVLEYTLTFGRVDQLSFLFCLLFHIAAAVGQAFALHVRDSAQHVSSLLYAGGAGGAVLAGDLVTLFLFWELMAVSSAFLVWAQRRTASHGAGMRYLFIQILSGMLLLVGALSHYLETGSLAFDYIGLNGLGGTLIFLAFGIKCAWPMLHSWVVDAYPESTPTGAVFLSALTTKTAIYVLCRGYPGTEILIYIGAIMTMFPIFFAVIENDLRRVLAYSMINQVGFMVVGIGIGTELALNGAVSHAFTHVIYKSLLFMSMGAVLHMTGRINGSDLGGLYKSMPITTICCIIGAASISAFPLFSGFISKAMVMSAAAHEGYSVVFLALLFAAAGVFHHAGIKIPFFAFFAHDSGIRTKEAPWNMLLAMATAAAMCVVIGVYPSLLYDMLPWPVNFEPYTVTHVITQLQLLTFSALAFTLLMISGLYPPELRLINLDVDWFYRRLGYRGVMSLGQAIGRAWTRLLDGLRTSLLQIGLFAYRHHGPEGAMARTHPTGRMVFWAVAMLAAYLLLDFFVGASRM